MLHPCSPKTNLTSMSALRYLFQRTSDTPMGMKSNSGVLLRIGTIACQLNLFLIFFLDPHLVKLMYIMLHLLRLLFIVKKLCFSHFNKKTHFE